MGSLRMKEKIQEKKGDAMQKRNKKAFLLRFLSAKRQVVMTLLQYQ